MKKLDLFIITTSVLVLFALFLLIVGCGANVGGSLEIKDGIVVGGTVGITLPKSTTQPVR